MEINREIQRHPQDSSGESVSSPKKTEATHRQPQIHRAIWLNAKVTAD
jgi:hypothetical protein